MKRNTKHAALAVAVVLPLTLTLGACSGSPSTGGDGDDQTLTVWAWDPTFNIYALEEAEKLYQLHGVADRFVVVHPDYAHDFEDATRRQAYEFIDGQLDFSPVRKVP